MVLFLFLLLFFLFTRLGSFNLTGKYPSFNSLSILLFIISNPTFIGELYSCSTTFSIFALFEVLLLITFLNLTIELVDPDTTTNALLSHKYLIKPFKFKFLTLD